MHSEPRICAVIPVFNHHRTVGAVATQTQALLPVMVVDDGSTDQTPVVLAQITNLNVLRLPQNRGKGAALQAGFVKARELGFTHAVTIDADGQHSPTDLPVITAVSQSHPEALIVGVRSFQAARVPWSRRMSNRLSNTCFRWETGQRLADTQCGYRCYPLLCLESLHVNSGRYAFELEILVRAAWAGIPLLSCPVAADYEAVTSRLSHFHPARDLAHVAGTHVRLLVERCGRSRQPSRQPTASTPLP
jgi:glycosyltransferase involved in cell wall biosynthesis